MRWDGHARRGERLYTLPLSVYTERMVLITVIALVIGEGGALESVVIRDAELQEAVAAYVVEQRTGITDALPEWKPGELGACAEPPAEAFVNPDACFKNDGKMLIEANGNGKLRCVEPLGG